MWQTLGVANTRSKRSRVPGTKRDTRRPLEAKPPDREAEAAEAARVEERVAAGELSFRDVHELALAEDMEVGRLARVETVWLRRLSDEKPEMPSSAVPRPAGSLSIGRVLRALPTVDDGHVDLILGEYEFDEEWTFGQIGTAETDVIESALRLVRAAAGSA